MKGNREHKGTEAEDVKGKGKEEGSPMPYLAVEVQHFVEDKGGAEKEDKGKPLKVGSLEDISEREERQDSDAESEPCPLGKAGLTLRLGSFFLSGSFQLSGGFLLSGSFF